MICGNCHCERKNVLISRNYQTSNGNINIVNIPALACDCEELITQSVLMEIQDYLKKNQQAASHEVQFENI